MCGFLRGCGLYQPSPPTVRFADETPAGRPGPDAIRPRAAASPTRPPDGPRRGRARPPRPRGTGVSLPLSDAPPRTVGTAAAPRREPTIEPGTRSADRPATDSGLPGTHRHRRDRPGAAPRRPAAREAPAPLAEVRVTLRRRRGGSRRTRRRPPGEVEGRPAAAKTDARAAVPGGPAVRCSTGRCSTGRSGGFGRASPSATRPSRCCGATATATGRRLPGIRSRATSGRSRNRARGSPRRFTVRGATVTSTSRWRGRPLRNSAASTPPRSRSRPAAPCRRRGSAAAPDPAPRPRDLTV